MSSKNENENEKENQNKNGETLMSSNNNDDYEINKLLISSHQDYDNDEINIRINKLNDHLDKITDKSKSFEDQIKLIKK